MSSTVAVNRKSSVEPENAVKFLNPQRLMLKRKVREDKNGVDQIEGSVRVLFGGVGPTRNSVSGR